MTRPFIIRLCAAAFLGFFPAGCRDKESEKSSPSQSNGRPPRSGGTDEPGRRDPESRPSLPPRPQPRTSKEWLDEVSRITATNPQEALKVAVKRLEGTDLMLALDNIEVAARDQPGILPLDNYQLVPDGPNREYWIERLSRDAARKDLKIFAEWVPSLDRRYQAHAADEAISAIAVRQDRVGLKIGNDDLLSQTAKIADTLSTPEAKADFISKATPVFEKQGIEAAKISDWTQMREIKPGSGNSNRNPSREDQR